MKILLVEDHDETAAFIVRGITEAGDSVTHVSDGKPGVSSAIEPEYDVGVFARMCAIPDG